MNNVALGQYMPLDSVVHKMDPRSKIMIMLFLMVAIFIPAGVLDYRYFYFIEFVFIKIKY